MEKTLFEEKANIKSTIILSLLLSGLMFFLSYGFAMNFFGRGLYDLYLPCMFLGILCAVLLFVILFFGRDSKICITNKKVYGKTLFGKIVDIPIDSISSVAVTNPLLQGISVSSSSGKISFYLIANKDEAYKIISDLLINRQDEKEKVAPQTIEIKSDEADQLKKYKDLLDSGVITQEEFDAKKKQLLGL